MSLNEQPVIKNEPLDNNADSKEVRLRELKQLLDEKIITRIIKPADLHNRLESGYMDH